MADKQVDLDPDVQKARARKEKRVLYALILLLLGALGVMGTLFWQNTAERPEPLTIKQAHYLTLERLVVNFLEGSPRFLQLDVELMATDPSVLRRIDEHMPAIRNDVLFLLAGQEPKVIGTREGKERLRKEIREVIQELLVRYAPEGTAPGELEGVYFTSFVMQ